MSTLEPRKGLVYLVRAFERLASLHPDIRLVLTGKPGWGMDELLAEFRDPAVAERILLPGYVSDQERSWLLRNAHVFAYPSLYEGFGLPLLEAMSVGTPVVTTNVGAIYEVAAEAAMMVAPRAVDELAQALELLLDESETRAAMIARGYARAAQFSWKANGEQMASLYAKAVQG
jgi:glycosyltransferase involved in cell wall biosynthesis